MTDEKEFFMEPFCCACGKNPEAITPAVILPNPIPIYWFLFPSEKDPDGFKLDVAQGIDDILKEVEKLNEPEKFNDSPDGKEKEKRLPPFVVRYTKMFKYDLRQNCLCPDCAKEYLTQQLEKAQDEEGTEDFLS